jgi:hypothetical protein
MGMQSIVTGYIKLHARVDLRLTRRTIAHYPFDENRPFSNNFWCGSPVRYAFPLIGVCGSFKQIEDAWAEWL